MLKEPPPNRIGSGAVVAEKKYRIRCDAPFRVGRNGWSLLRIQEFLRIHHVAVVEHRKMQVRGLGGFGGSCVPHGTDQLTG